LANVASPDSFVCTSASPDLSEDSQTSRRRTGKEGPESTRHAGPIIREQGREETNHRLACSGWLAAFSSLTHTHTLAHTEAIWDALQFLLRHNALRPSASLPPLPTGGVLRLPFSSSRECRPFIRSFFFGFDGRGEVRLNVTNKAVLARQFVRVSFITDTSADATTAAAAVGSSLSSLSSSRAPESLRWLLCKRAG